MSTEKELLPSDDGAREFVDTVMVARPRHELYAFWRDFANLPKFMENVQSVTPVDSLSSVWSVKDSAGQTAEWEFLVTDDEQDHFIAWSTSGNTPVKFSGRVEFTDTPTAAQTQVTATLHYAAPSGLIETLVAKVAGTQDPAETVIQTRADLLRFKDYMERSANR